MTDFTWTNATREQQEAWERMDEAEMAVNREVDSLIRGEREERRRIMQEFIRAVQEAADHAARQMDNMLESIYDGDFSSSFVREATEDFVNTVMQGQ